jgi:RimJ/RimL family protein N-acetyltransferase
MDTTILSDGVVLLRPVTPEYSPGMTAAVLESLESLSPWMSWANPGYTDQDNLEWIERMRQGWERGHAFQFVILNPQDESVLGGCGLNHVHPSYRFANLGYWVRSSRRGRGIAPRATRLVARFAFEQLGILRVEIVAAVQNQASLRTAEKAGARREGLLRNRMVVRDQVYEAVMHSLVPEDFGLKET